MATNQSLSISGCMIFAINILSCNVYSCQNMLIFIMKVKLLFGWLSIHRHQLFPLEPVRKLATASPHSAKQRSCIELC